MLNSNKKNSTLFNMPAIKRLAYLPLLLLIVLLITTAWVWYYVQKQSHTALQDYFDFRVRQAVALTEQRILAQEHVLLGTKGLFDSADQVTLAEFQRYIASLHLEENYPGIQGVGFSKVIPPAEKANHIAQIRKDSSHQEYIIWPEGERDFYTSIIYLEPFYGRNLRAFGYDMYTDPVRRVAMEKSRDTGDASMTAKVKLVQEDGKNIQAGFLIYLPVYKQNQAHGTTEERRENLLGWVYSPFRMADLAHGMYGERATDLDIEIYDGDEITPQSLMYDSIQIHSNDPQLLSSTKKVKLIDHEWTLVLRSTPLLATRFSNRESTIVAYTGSILSFLLSALLWLVINGRSRALRYARRMNHELNCENEKNRALLRNAGDGIHILDCHGNIVEVSDSFCLMLGYERDEMIGMNVHEWDAGFVEPELTRKLKMLFEKNERIQFETRHRRKNETTFEVEVNTVTIHLDGTPYLHASARDISERKQQELKLRQVTKEQQAMLDNELVGIMKVKDRKIVWRNKAMDRIFGYEGSELLNSSTRCLYKDSQTYKRIGNIAYPILAGNGVYRTQLEMVRNDGKIVWIDLSGVSLPDEGAECMWMLMDITAMKQHEQEVTKIAYHDTLTGLPNRLLVSNRLTQALASAERHKQMLAVCFLDLDGFKPINDNYGHNAGDALLKEVANRMLASVRANDTVGRLGGDEFVLILTDLNSIAEYQLIVDRVATSINEPVEINDVTQIKIGVSIGVAFYPTDGLDPDTLLRCADHAMYQAKQSGRNQVCFFSQPELFKDIMETTL